VLPEQRPAAHIVLQAFLFLAAKRGCLSRSFSAFECPPFAARLSSVFFRDGTVQRCPAERIGAARCFLLPFRPAPTDGRRELSLIFSFSFAFEQLCCALSGRLPAEQRSFLSLADRAERHRDYFLLLCHHASQQPDRHSDEPADAAEI